MTKWEYKDLDFSVKLQTFKKPHSLIKEDYLKELNEEGKKGWELVKVIHFMGTGMKQDLKFILKREIQSKDKSYF
jgi:hypothetical protein